MTLTTVTPAARVLGAQLARDMKVKAAEVKSPTEVYALTLTVHPGGTTDWHSHPELTVTEVAKGNRIAELG